MVKPVNLNKPSTPEPGAPLKQAKPENGSKRDNLSTKEKVKESLGTGFKYMLAPFAALSTASSIASFVLANILKKETQWVDKFASVSNRISYFLNGVFGGIGNGVYKDYVGALGYSIVSMASLFGNNENIYQLKGPGSALDQMPAMLKAVATNPKILENYPKKDGKNNFYSFTSFGNNLDKTFDAVRIVSGDIYRDLKEKIPNGFLTALKGTFFGDKKRSAERNLLLSSTGLLLGSFLNLGLGLKKLGSSIRDISGGYADIALISRGGAEDNEGKASGAGNIKYMLSGIFYGVASAIDLVYRWTGLPKLDLAAVGIDNAGFLFMNWANREDILESEKTEQAAEETQQPSPQPQPALGPT